MNRNFTKLYELPAGASEKEAPVVIGEGTLLRDDTTDSVLARLHLQCKGEKPVKKVVVSVQALNGNGSPVGDVEEAAWDRAEETGSKEEYGEIELMLPWTAHSFTAEIKEVVFTEKDDGETGSGNGTAGTDETAPEAGKGADSSSPDEDLQKPSEEPDTDTTEEKAGTEPSADDPDGAGVKREEDLPAAADECAPENEEAEAEENTEDDAEEEEEGEESRFSWKTLLVAAIPAVLILSGLLAILFMLKITPDRNYRNASSLYQEGRYEEAAAAFDAMNGYKDSDARAAEARNAKAYVDAVQLLNEGKYSEAINALRKLGSYQNSAARADEIEENLLSAAYSEAETLLAQSRLFEAATAFYRIAEYSDARERCFAVWSELTKQEKISAGIQSLICLRDGTCEAAGENSDGECDVADWKDIIAVSAGSSAAVGLRADGTVVATGDNSEGQCDVEGWRDIVAVSSGYWNTAGLKADGTVVLTGHPCDVSDWSDITQVSTGIFHTVGLRKDSSVVAARAVDYTGQSHDYGQCDVETWGNITQVAAGMSFTVALCSNGTVVAAGDNTYGQCDVGEWTDIVAIDASGWHTVGLKADGTVLAVGLNENGECDVEEWTDIVAVSTGNAHTLGLKADGTVVAVGNNRDGRCDVENWKIR